MQYRILLLLLCSFVSFQITAQTDDWPGWRGLDRQGQGHTIHAPVEWSDSTYIIWKTTLHGEGHSSPIVSGDHIFVTSAWQSETQTTGKTVLQILISILALACLAGFLRQLHHSTNNSDKHLIERPTFWILLGLIFHGLIFTHWHPQGFDASGPVMQFGRWFLSGTLIILSVLLLLTTIGKASRARFIGGLAIIAAALMLFAVRPHPEYFELRQTDVVFLTRMHLPMLFMLGSGFILIAHFFFVNRKAGQQQSSLTPQRKRISKMPYLAFILGLGGFFVFVATNIMKPLYLSIFYEGNFFPGHVATLRDKLWFLVNPVSSYPWYLFIVNSGFLLWLYLFTRKDTSVDRASVKFASLLIFLVCISFYGANYLKSKPAVDYGIIAIDRSSGEILWQKSGLTAEPPNTTRFNSQASPTPIADGERVYGYFGTPGLICYDYEGNRLWARAELPFEGIHGIGASPVIAGDNIIILSAMSKAPFMAAINRYSGETSWRVDLKSWEGLHGEHRTPTIARHDGRLLIIDWRSGANKTLNIFDASDGVRLTSYPTPWPLTGEAMTSVIVNEERLFLTNRIGVFALDLNKLMAGDEDCLLWQANLGSRGPNTASPVHLNGMLFMVSDKGWATSIDTDNGEILWRARLAQGNYFSSPIAANAMIYFSSTGGVTSVVRAGKEFELLKANKLDGQLYASPALVDRQLIIRSTEHLLSIGSLAHLTAQ